MYFVFSNHHATEYISHVHLLHRKKRQKNKPIPSASDLYINFAPKYTLHRLMIMAEFYQNSMQCREKLIFKPENVVPRSHPKHGSSVNCPTQYNHGYLCNYQSISSKSHQPLVYTAIF